MVDQIEPNKVYNTEEVQAYLKTSPSTIKRLLKKGILRANKVGGRYKILGSEILRLVSPVAEIKVKGFYHRIKEQTRKAIEKW